MGMYNVLILNIISPYCGYEGEMESEFKIGYLNIDSYRLGDKIKWADGIAKKPHQRRPLDGNFTGEGYVECPQCLKDFWLKIFINNDTLTDVTIDSSKTGYVK